MEIIEERQIQWFKACRTEDVPENGGTCIKCDENQIAIFNLALKGEWYATQNLCPHKMQMILSRGMIGDSCGEPKVACPFHKKSFSLKSGENLNGEAYKIKVYPVKVDEGYVYIGIEE